MKETGVKLVVYSVTMIPSCIFFFYDLNCYTFILFMLISGTLYHFAIKMYCSFITSRYCEGFHMGLNAINHNINEALLASARKNERICLADSLSIKENLYALSAVGAVRFFPQNYSNIEPLVSVTLRDYQQLADQYGLRFSVSFDADQSLRIIRVDTGLLNKVFSIVLSNAISLTPPNGKLSVSTRLHKDSYDIIVTDTSDGLTSSIIQALKSSSTYSLGRRVDIHNRIHYGLGLVALRRLLAGSNIRVHTKKNSDNHSVIIKISRKSNAESMKGCASF